MPRQEASDRRQVVCGGGDLKLHGSEFEFPILPLTNAASFRTAAFTTTYRTTFQFLRVGIGRKDADNRSPSLTITSGRSIHQPLVLVVATDPGHRGIAGSTWILGEPLKLHTSDSEVT